jgi:iron complex transport system substrate-binding protein
MFKARSRVVPIVVSVAAIVFASLLTNPAQAAGVKYPLTISSGGYKTTLKKAPQRIISLSPSATEILFSIGADKQVLLVDSLSNYPKRAPISDISAFEPNVEAIVGKKPDLVVLSVDAMKSAEVRKALIKLKVPVLMEKAPTELKDVYAEINVLGKVTNKAVKADALAKKMAADIKRILTGAKKSKGVRIYHELDDTYYSVTSDTFIGHVYKDFGVTNVADAAAGADSYGYPQLSAEYLLKSDPQAIFLADAQYGVTADSVSKRAGWSQISAVKNNKVFALAADVPSRWGPRLVDFYRAIAQALAKIS